MTYTKHYQPGGFQNGASGSTPITAQVCNDFDNALADHDTRIDQKVAKTGDSMSNDLSFSADDKGVTLYGGAKVYKKSGSSLRLKASDDTEGIGIENAAGTRVYQLPTNGTGDPQYNGNKIFHAGNDGSGSGLDADSLDGFHATDIPSAGVIMMYGGTSPPSRWLECNGQAVSRTGQYAALFAAIGTNYGAGDGSTTFNVPEMRGEFPRGWDHGRGVDSGRSLGTAQADAIKRHTHKYAAQANTGGNPGAYPGSSSSPSDAPTDGGYDGGTSLNTVETRPRNVSVMFIIKY
ncbi:MAG TPA: phage tail protein [Methanocella sp.]|jgi:microcystin-dependent protein